MIQSQGENGLNQLFIPGLNRVPSANQDFVQHNRLGQLINPSQSNQR